MEKRVSQQSFKERKCNGGAGKKNDSARLHNFDKMRAL
jgi:hypothetical protein